ncbi:TonB-dependent receptor [Cellvibrio fibrivorans]|uniref:TonB-dependent receptor n=1 Tax=Cellvibrio fibrivorans TaxID=126350 RepID=A0ABU1V1G9_9GAMM|nr:TonB-dependent receptor [Cellvibrio fibrivorans]MDR7091222.1 TonB-dependent receptor [Cellvibrio fibrivorans]
MRMFKLNPLVLAMAACTLPMSVYAQDSGDGTVEEVVVTGSFRDSLQNAMNIKKNQNGFVDAIVASDIAEFPDNNLAESLQRVPGVAISRSGGEGRNITVRGLGPGFTTVRLNGMETISTTGGTDAVGGNNRGRGFDFNTFSSDLFSSLTVRKTNSAEVQEGSLGATVDLKAAQPFDYDDFVLTASGSLGYNDLSEESDPGAAFLVSNIFADGKFGALFSLSYSERSVQDEGSSTVRWTNASAQSFGKYKGATITPTNEINTAFRPRIPRYDSYQHEMERLGSSLSLQFRPTDSTEISLDGLWAKFDANRQEVFMQGSLNPGANATSNVLDYAIEGNTLVYADIEGARLLSENRYDEMSTDFSQGTITLKQDFTDTFRLKAMLGSTKSDYDNPIQNTLLMQANNQRFTYDYRDYSSPVLTFGTAAYNKASWTATGVRQRPQTTVNENDAATVAFEYDVSDSIKLKIGTDYKDFSFSTDQYAYASEGANGVNIQSNPDFITEYDSGLGDDQPWLIPNRALIMESYNLFDLALVPNYGSNYEVGEETTGVFAQIDFNFEIGSVPVSGDIGVRRFETDQTSSGWLNGTLASRSYVTVEHNYSDTLPALNIKVEPMEDVVLRASYSEGISRAGLGSIVPAVSVGVAGTNLNISGANPLLEPTKAKSYDLGAEWYFGEGSLVSVTLFKKEIESHIQTLRSTPIYTETGLPTEAAVNACNTQGASLGGYGSNCNENLPWNYSAPANGPGGDLDGYEISYQQPFTFLPGFLSNFGFIGSYTSVDSDLDYLSAASDITNGNLIVQATKPLVNLSDETTSATLYWENDVFSGRVSLASRSGYLTTPIGRDGNDEEGTNETTNVDASFGYQFNDSLKFTFEALNLTDEVDDQWVGSEDNQRLSYYHNTGIQYNLGVQYKY